MNRVFGWMGVAALIVAAVGCSPCDCRRCGGPHAGRHGGLGHGGFAHGGGPGGGIGGGGGAYGSQYAPGPQTPTVVYPYYTTRGPRDFLSANPRGIGP